MKLILKVCLLAILSFGNIHGSSQASEFSFQKFSAPYMRFFERNFQKCMLMARYWGQKFKDCGSNVCTKTSNFVHDPRVGIAAPPVLAGIGACAIFAGARYLNTTNYCKEPWSLRGLLYGQNEYSQVIVDGYENVNAYKQYNNFQSSKCVVIKGGQRDKEAPSRFTIDMCDTNLGGVKITFTGKAADTVKKNILEYDSIKSLSNIILPFIQEAANSQQLLDPINNICRGKRLDSQVVASYYRNLMNFYGTKCILPYTFAFLLGSSAAIGKMIASSTRYSGIY